MTTITRITRVADGQHTWMATESELLDAMQSQDWERHRFGVGRAIYTEPDADDPAEQYTLLCEAVAEVPATRWDSTLEWSDEHNGWVFDPVDTGELWQ